ncbi:MULTISPECIES: TDT family transporter [unclassified Rhodococcus (in: high G+C Gram-positive bacteria)]|uniref:TDT family transporter n=1 Tax=unclassified Rhodococcus (in: high G+C Gram-positive bacteria) TaxID=192944 RepID=UPI000B9BB535|nr:MULTISPECIES: TDT family transporter [unclassified Rhodococcus (in: high G+C Gram-positive bacteria)]OZE42332.1 C4-dicarboxylate ABC transporter [Rhodococcus sp. 05-2254-4]OZE50072.1 C4-dicarboxylate ABC transporter [Rhodococcus sp. 05-2254-3]OZE50935.1 C4-dicarboxylate ABC transporter [Rhodococcus sp. 05-2254-2]
MTVTALTPAVHPRTFEHITPNWFAAVMGTGIVATAAATLPVQFPTLHVFAVAVWVIAATALAVIGGAFARHWIRHRDRAVEYARHPVMVQFYGAPPMAMLTVGAGAGLLGADVLGPTAATALFAGLWTAGTIAGLLTSVVVPYRMITASDHRDVAALPAWLMPVVPPMVSASTGALLLPHLPEGQWRLALLCACYAMFGLSLIVGMITLTLIYGRLLHGGLPPVDAAPTVWITLGLIGQSITAANLLGTDASMVFTGTQASVAVGLHVFGIGYGLIMGGFGMLMFALATALTVHAARRDLGFSLTWWSFTFPIGTCVTGATALGHALNFGAVQALAVALYVLLLAAWLTVATRTVRGIRRGELLHPDHR